MRSGDLREDARQLLMVAYERQVARGAEVTRVDLGAGARQRGLGPGSSRLDALVDFMETMGWIEPDPFVRPVTGEAVRRITARGLEVLREQ